jgi:hypothetical protein
MIAGSRYGCFGLCSLAEIPASPGCSRNLVQLATVFM